MKAVATFFFLTLLAACATTGRTATTGRIDYSPVVGTYDLVSLGSQPVPNATVTRLWLVITPQGTWEMHEEPRTRFGGSRGFYATGETVDNCHTLDLWAEANPAAKAPMEVCPEGSDSIGYLTPAWMPGLNLDGPMVFKRRQ